MKTLIELLQPFCAIKLRDDVEVKHLTQDSREVKEGSVFFAYPGDHVDGRRFIESAIQRGAVAIVHESDVSDCEDFHTHEKHPVPFVPVDHLAEKLGLIAARFYDYPTQAMTLIGVTGTNGKTSITHFIAEALTHLQHKTAVVGTTGYGFLPTLTQTGFTTPDAVSLQRVLQEIYCHPERDYCHPERDYCHPERSEGSLELSTGQVNKILRYAQDDSATQDDGATQDVAAVAMEVSSHGLQQHRLSGVEFDYAIFTNLTRDHLDYHKTLEAYQAAKFKLFDEWPLKAGVFNLDDATGAEFARRVVQRYPVVGYSLDAEIRTAFDCVVAKKIVTRVNGFDILVKTPWGEGAFTTPLLGQFNVANLLAVIALLGVMEFSLADILSVISKLKTVTGRMQLVSPAQHATTIVDYSHTPDALQKALQSLREHCKGELWCVFGCGGDRDAGKRPQMGSIAEQYADHLIITDDNPRHEDSQKIIEDILEGIQHQKTAKVLPDREQAIHFALENAAKDDVVLIAGKGHETYQIIGDTMHEFSDQRCVEHFYHE